MSYEIKDATRQSISEVQSWYTSEKPAVPRSLWYVGKQEPANSLRAGERLHDHDAELKAVNALANAIVKAWPAANTNDAATWKGIASGFTGQVRLGCSQGPCHSCRWVIRQISSDMPNVTFYVTYAAKDVNRPVTQKEGTEVSLYGEYGYKMAKIGELKTVWGVTVQNGTENGYIVPAEGYPKDPPGGEPVANFDESSIG
ncbi:hypothetical protein [Streptomyces apricus]|uniref:Uncharacterized protein n=1 Tax=Streptomyces apricus TaxID=1828112 RepID=A0A5B0A8I9_9ACTN|nr:hypothetical protein [Streptomyces apricus]KAA0925436.1 hypothetical protein FGF04_32890 [Streptomyces apricus]